MTNFTSASAFAIVQTDINRYLPEQAAKSATGNPPREELRDLIAPEPRRTITQRKAKYHDKLRTKRKDVQAWVLRRTGMSSTAEIKAALKKLGKKLDLRLTSAWIEVNLNWCDRIQGSNYKVGDRVAPIEYTARTAYAEVWSPHYILDVVDGEAVLDMLTFRVPLSNLRKVS